MHDNAGVVDEYGLVADSWWAVRTTGLPDRTLRLREGPRSLCHLLQRYGYQDSTGCVNHRDATAHYGPSSSLATAHLQVLPHIRDMTGVAQFYPRSGICWYAALCTVLFTDPKMREYIASHLPPAMAELCATCLKSRESAQRLRNLLWTEWAIGDDINDRPENDGCNGFSEFTLLCARASIPLLRLRERGGKLVRMPPRLTDKRGNALREAAINFRKPHLLALRFQDGDHAKFPLFRRVRIDGVRYRWVGCWAGQRKCGHQIGFASADGHWRSIVVGDADLHNGGIGLESVCFPQTGYADVKGGDSEWSRVMNLIIHITKFGPRTSEFCNMSPLNPRDDSLDQYRGSRARVGSNSLDMLYRADL